MFLSSLVESGVHKLRAAFGFKALKGSCTHVLEDNIYGDSILGSLLIYHSENPWALKGFIKTRIACSVKGE
jgi:hypothetical protein